MVGALHSSCVAMHPPLVSTALLDATRPTGGVFSMSVSAVRGDGRIAARLRRASRRGADSVRGAVELRKKPLEAALGANELLESLARDTIPADLLGDGSFQLALGGWPQRTALANLARSALGLQN